MLKFKTWLILYETEFLRSEDLVPPPVHPGYVLCVLDYEFHILDNAFLVHKPGIKTLQKDTARAILAAKTNSLIRKVILPELKAIYGTRKGCVV
ncbi:hypothetical protein RUM43_010334 [Polyplax serrata]|uniref:Uncharacterized protein n=1 Tax=Polyplax serrata TaxID=468196 RepID=A0AAN8S0E1_POLSC